LLYWREGSALGATGVATGGLVAEVAALSDHITLEVHDSSPRQLAAQYGVDRIRRSAAAGRAAEGFSVRFGILTWFPSGRGHPPDRRAR
jgi:hypothetical protein